MRIVTKPLVLVGLVLVVLFSSVSPAYAHTEFESSDPADQSEIDEVLSEMRLTFAGVAEPAGEGFVILDGDGSLRKPTSVSTEDQLTYVLTFDPPLGGGEVGVRWSVAAPDAHPIDGAFSFTVNASLPAPPINDPSDAVAAVDEPAALAAVAVDDSDSPAVRESELAGEVNPGDEGYVDAAAIESDVEATEFASSIDEFLSDEAPEAAWVDVVGALARTMSLGGILMAIGGAVFAAFVMRGTMDELSMVVTSIRVAASLVVVGAAVELITQFAVVNGNWATLTPVSTMGEVIWSAFGAAVGLKMVGGLLMLRAGVTVVTESETVDPVVQLRQLVPVGAVPMEAAQTVESVAWPDARTSAEHNFVWRSHGDSMVVPVGIAVVAASFLFDGHTVSEGNRIFTGVVDIVHVVAGAVWAGGLVSLAQVIWRRHRRGDDSRALQLAVRFSVVAAIALVVAGVAGSVLAVIILDSVSDLWGTTWGQVLMLKTMLVGLAGAAGLYNHRVLIPKMATAQAGNAEAEIEFRRAVSFEGLVIASVVVATAVLVAASSV